MSDLSLPPFLMTSDPGSFARNTIIERKPQIIRQVLADNDYVPEVLAALEAFREEIASRPLQPLIESAPDVADWNHERARYAGKTWLEIPWYFAATSNPEKDRGGTHLGNKKRCKWQATFSVFHPCGSSLPRWKQDGVAKRCCTPACGATALT
jgi:hypothetical protein